MSGRLVKRVLLMVEYPDGPTDGGEVHDITALVLEMLPHCSYTADLRICVEARRNHFAQEGQPKHELKIDFGSYTGNSNGMITGASHLADVINSALPDDEKVSALRRKSARCAKKAEDLKHDAMRAKLEQVAKIRHLHPIARFETSVAITEGGPAS
jgi:hypothetical protein